MYSDVLVDIMQLHFQSKSTEASGFSGRPLIALDLSIFLILAIRDDTYYDGRLHSWCYPDLEVTEYFKAAAEILPRAKLWAGQRTMERS